MRKTNKAFSFAVFLGLWAALWSPSSVLGEGPPHERIRYEAIDENGDFTRQITFSVLAVELDTNEIQSLDSAVIGVETLLDNGPPSNRIDLVIVGDGYTYSELSQYANDAELIAELFLDEEPLRSYASFFNVYRVDVVSAQSGVDNDPLRGIEKDTALDMYFWCFDIERLLCIHAGKAKKAAKEAPEVDTILALANTSKYGGAGYAPGSVGLATLSARNSAAVELSLHEAGHSIARLVDEYVVSGGAPCWPSLPNVSRFAFDEMLSKSRKWFRWLDHPNVNTFLGGCYNATKYYRPTFNSKMRSLRAPFGEVNSEQFVINFYRFVEPLDDLTPIGTYPKNTTFFVDPVSPVTHGLDIRWFLDGEAIAGENGKTLRVPTEISKGNHKISVEVVDNTQLVRDERKRARWMTARRTWTVSVP